MWKARSEFQAMSGSFLEADTCFIIILTLINLVNMKQLKMSQEMSSVFQEMRKSKEVSWFFFCVWISMLDTHLCVEVIQFQIEIKLVCVHLTWIGKYTHLISTTIEHLPTVVVSSSSVRADLHSELPEVSVSICFPLPGLLADHVPRAEHCVGRLWLSDQVESNIRNSWHYVIHLLYNLQ